MNYFIRGFAASVCVLSMMSQVSACSLGGLQHEINFDSGESTLGAKNAGALVGWFLEWRDGLGVEYALVVAKSIKGDKKSLDLSTLRMRAVSQIPGALNNKNVTITYADSFVESPTSYGVDSLTVSIQPACAKTDTCCFQPVNK